MKLVVTVTILLVLGCGCGLFDGYECKVVEFIFGDSLSDVGNNNHLPRSLAKPNLPWYGIDFGNGLPNGRFTNGRTVLDFMGDAMGIPRAPAYLDPNLDQSMILENGVNYASGGGGVLNETGRYFIQRYCFDTQIDLFKGTQELIKRKIGKNKSDEFFRDALYITSFGSNDFLNNYLMPVYGDPWLYNDKSFIQYLVETYEKQLKMLHQLGARKVLVFGLAPLGCIPLQRVLGDTGGCQEDTNKLAQSFNYGLGKMVAKLSKTLPNAASFKFGDTYDFVYDIVNNPFKYGFTNSDSPCCSYGDIRPSLTCTPASSLCEDRSKFFFWDEYHPTDTANQLVAKEFLVKFGIVKANQDEDHHDSSGPALPPTQDATDTITPAAHN